MKPWIRVIMPLAHYALKKYERDCLPTIPPPPVKPETPVIQIPKQWEAPMPTVAEPIPEPLPEPGPITPEPINSPGETTQPDVVPEPEPGESPMANTEDILTPADAVYSKLKTQQELMKQLEQEMNAREQRWTSRFADVRTEATARQSAIADLRQQVADLKQQLATRDSQIAESTIHVKALEGAHADLSQQLAQKQDHIPPQTLDGAKEKLDTAVTFIDQEDKWLEERIKWLKTEVAA